MKVEYGGTRTVRAGVQVAADRSVARREAPGIVDGTSQARVLVAVSGDDALGDGQRFSSLPPASPDVGAGHEALLIIATFDLGSAARAQNP